MVIVVVWAHVVLVVVIAKVLVSEIAVGHFGVTVGDQQVGVAIFALRALLLTSSCQAPQCKKVSSGS